MSDLNLTPKAQQALALAKKNAQRIKQNFVTSEHILLGILDLDTTAGVEILKRSGVNIIDFKKFIKKNLQKVTSSTRPALSEITFSPRAQRTIALAGVHARKLDQDTIGVEHLLLGILAEDAGLGHNIFQLAGIDTDKLSFEILRHLDPSAPRSKLNNKKNPGVDLPPLDVPETVSAQPARGTTNRSSSSEKLQLEEFAVNLSQLAKSGELPPVIGREEEINRALQILLRKQKNNPMLIGDAGVGKTAIVEGLAQRIASGAVPDSLFEKEIYTLDLAQVVAGTIYRGQFEERLKSIINECVEAGNIILFIDEIHTLVGAGGASSAMDASNILKPALSRGQITCVGATTIDEYRKYIESDKALDRRFQSIDIKAPTAEQTITIIKEIKDTYERHHKVRYTNNIIKLMVDCCTRYIPDRNFPDKAIDILDEIGAKLRLKSFVSYIFDTGIEKELAETQRLKIKQIENQNFEEAAKYRKLEEDLAKEYDKLFQEWEKSQDKIIKVTDEDVFEHISKITGIPSNKLDTDDIGLLQGLQKSLQKNIIGQDTACEKAATAIKRSKAGINDPDKPICSFLFLGPSGVGKTYTSKMLSELIFNSEDNFVQIDMSEYMEPHSISKLIGSPPGYVGFGQESKLTDLVKRRPYSVVLFDEIEKAHPDVLQIFLQLLEEGVITDSKGTEINFKNTIVIMTSNVGAQHIAKNNTMGFGSSVDDTEEKIMRELKNTFRPEFINRLDEVVLFNKLEDKHYNQIAKNNLTIVRKRLQKNKISIKFDKSVAEFLTDKCTETADAAMGARPLKRLITKYIENPLADFLIDNSIVNTAVKVNASSSEDGPIFEIAE